MLCRRSLWFYTCRYRHHLWKHPGSCFASSLTCEMCHVFQDTFDGSATNEPFFTSVASITVLVKDVDNRPPWFQPCLRTNLGIAKLCVSTGYRGKVNLTEKEVSQLHPKNMKFRWNFKEPQTWISVVKLKQKSFKFSDRFSKQHCSASTVHLLYNICQIHFKLKLTHCLVTRQMEVILICPLIGEERWWNSETCHFIFNYAQEETLSRELIRCSL